MTVYVQAIQTIRPLTPAAFDTWVDFYGDQLAPRMRAHGFDFLGAWKRSSGRQNQVLVLTRFESLAAYESASASLFNDRDLGRALNVLLKEIRFDEEIAFGSPVPYADEQRLERALADRPAAPRRYLQALIPVRFGGQRTAYRLVGEAVDAIEQSGAMRLVAAYDTISGLRGVLNDFWVLPPGAGSAYRHSGAPNDLLDALREVAPEEEFVFLDPLPFSPLQ